MIYKAFCAFLGLLIFSPLGFASSRQPNLQEMRALQQQQVEQQQKKQQVGIIKKQRDELLASYKEILRVREMSYSRMKTSQRDYKTATFKFEEAQKKRATIENQLVQVKMNKAKLDKTSLNSQVQLLAQSQSDLVGQMNNFAQIRQNAYESMREADGQYRNSAAQAEIIKQKIESAQRQLQFVLSQP